MVDCVNEDVAVELVELIVLDVVVFVSVVDVEVDVVRTCQRQHAKIADRT